MGITIRTFDRWRRAGLKVYQPGTKAEFVFADDVFVIVRLDPASFPPAYKSPNAEKNKARKRNRKKE